MKTKHYSIRFAAAIMLYFSLPFPSLAFEYNIQFTASGASSSFDSIVVRNLSRGVSRTIYPGNTLILSDQVSAVDQVASNPASMQIFPNPFSTSAMLSFPASTDGNVRIEVFTVDGKKFTEAYVAVKSGNNTFQLSLPQGTYLIQCSGAGCNFVARGISTSGYTTAASITAVETAPLRTPSVKSRESAGYVAYSTGDVLLYTGYSDDYVTVVTDSPTGDKTQDFEFVVCRDADGNNYPVVKIGTQWWMAKNLNTTKFRNGESIPYVVAQQEWTGAYQTPAMCNNYDNAAYGLLYGKLYNWNAVNDSRGLAPQGWHVATHEEWTILKNHVDSHWGFLANVAKALSSHDYWRASTVDGSVGKNTQLNNLTGFNALPGGDRGGTNGTYFNVTEVGFWWTSTSFNISNAWYWYFSFDALYVVWDNGAKRFGMSVRCVKD